MGTKQYGSEEFKFFDYQFHIQLAKMAIDEAEYIVKTNPKLECHRRVRPKKSFKNI